MGIIRLLPLRYKSFVYYSECMTSKTSTSYRLSQETLDNIEWLRVRQGKKSGKAVIEELVNNMAGTLRQLDNTKPSVTIYPPRTTADTPLDGRINGKLDVLVLGTEAPKKDLKVEYDERPIGMPPTLDNDNP